MHEGALAIAPPIDLRRWLLPAALIGLMIDALISIWLMGGAPLRRPKARSRRLPSRPRSASFPFPHQARAAEAAPISDRDMDAALSTRLAYVVTGDATVDETSKLGLTALTRVLASRTSAELAEPIALDPARDELAFYPLIYWPIVAGLPQPQARGAHAHRGVHEKRRHARLRHARRADCASGRLADVRGALAARAARRASTCRSSSRCRATTC